jgi:hypothetical protein
LYADDNPLGLPVKQYKLALTIQDHSFKADGMLYYPAHIESHPDYDDVIGGNEVNLTDENFFPYLPNCCNVNGGVSLMNILSKQVFFSLYTCTYLAIFWLHSLWLWQSSLETSWW